MKNIVNYPLWYKLSEFVHILCEDRDESHGHDHMKKVAKNTLKILENDYPDEKQTFYNDVLIVAWLHDVNDHKYDKDGQLKVKLEEFIKKDLSDERASSEKLIIDIIERISFSRENKNHLLGKDQDWKQVIGDYGIKIRNIVSDADKIEALGKIGLKRCIQCSKEFYKLKHNKDITNDLLVKNVCDHSNEKLLILKDQFIRTNYGKKMAEVAHAEYLKYLNLFLKGNFKV